MDNNAPTTKNTTAFFAQSAIAFGLALFTMLVAIYYLPGDRDERTNLAAAYPNQVNALVARLDAWAQANQLRLIAGSDGDRPRGGGG